MSRSVSYANRAFVVAYEQVEFSEDIEALGDWEWNDYINDVIARAKKAFPSLSGCDKWLGREDHAILENRFVYFGISEYCGLVSIWLVLRDDLNYYSNTQSIAEQWAAQVQKKFYKTFGTLVKVGTFSNGESVYQRKEK